jgi:hypothetical protein
MLVQDILLHHNYFSLVVVDLEQLQLAEYKLHSNGIRIISIGSSGTGYASAPIVSISTPTTGPGIATASAFATPILKLVRFIHPTQVAGYTD